jgi:hypothetical protein
VVAEQDQPVLYGTWVLGQDYRNKSKLYGAYPPSYLDRVGAIFPDAGANVLHVFSGSLPPGPYVRLDLQQDAQRQPDVVGSVYEAAALLAGRLFPLVIADPPYSAADTTFYGTPMVNRGRALRALADVVAPGGHLVWLDTAWPMHTKAQWRTCGRIGLWRSTNHRVRGVTVFERRAG